LEELLTDEAVAALNSRRQLLTCKYAIRPNTADRNKMTGTMATIHTLRGVVSGTPVGKKFQGRELASFFKLTDGTCNSPAFHLPGPTTVLNDLGSTQVAADVWGFRKNGLFSLSESYTFQRCPCEARHRVEELSCGKLKFLVEG
jgi:hypothetical protein